MPEGDTVWLAARRLNDCLAGSVLTRSDLRVPHLATVDLAGATVEGVEAYGKHLLFHLAGSPASFGRAPDGRGLVLHTHFRMDGSWHLYRPGRPWRGGPAWQVRAVLETPDWQAVGYRLPVVELLDDAAVARLVGRLGPDILSEDVDLEAILRSLRERPDRAIGDALLDQSVVAGLGLIYVSETLFLRGVSPYASVATVPDLRELLRTGRELLRANRLRGAQASTGDLREQHYVYGRAGRPCRRCGTPIRGGRQASGRYERDAYWCPQCQAEPSTLS